MSRFNALAIAYSSPDPYGVKMIKCYIDDKKMKLTPLTVNGPYRWVRHPLYLFMILMIWSFPGLTIDRLLFNLLWSIWLVIATNLEERDLVSDFGEQYRKYQAKVPMLIPYRIIGKTNQF
jgi:methanethiol S-methyltransferase